jgi:hypothetical protein
MILITISPCHLSPFFETPREQTNVIVLQHVAYYFANNLTWDNLNK